MLLYVNADVIFYSENQISFQYFYGKSGNNWPVSAARRPKAFYQGVLFNVKKMVYSVSILYQSLGETGTHALLYKQLLNNA